MYSRKKKKKVWMKVLFKFRIKVVSNGISIFMFEIDLEWIILNFCGCCFYINLGKVDLNIKFYMYFICLCLENFIFFMFVFDKMEVSFL